MIAPTASRLWVWPSRGERGSGERERVMAAHGTVSPLLGAVREVATRVHGSLTGGKQEAKKPLDVLDSLLYPGHAGESRGPCASPVPCDRWRCEGVAQVGRTR